MGTSQQFSLRWNNYLRHITSSFDSLRNDADLVDVTLSCEGKKIRAHKMLLSACSSYFLDLFKENPCQHPVIIFRNVKFEDLAALVDFMYQGEVNVIQDQLASFLTTAELLQVQGLTDGSNKEPDPRENEGEIRGLPVETDMRVTSTKQSVRSEAPSPKFYPATEPETPPSKRRKWGASGGTPSASADVNARNMSGSSVSSPSVPPIVPEVNRDKDTERKKDTRRASSPVEIIPVPVKVEVPEYVELDDTSSGPSFDTQDVPQMSPLIHKSEGNIDSKTETDSYNSNQGDSNLPGSSDTLPAGDFSQVIAKPGPSNEGLSQDALQESDEFGSHSSSFSLREAIKTAGNILSSIGSKDPEKFPFYCDVCGKGFRHHGSVRQHRTIHTGSTRCPVCKIVFSRTFNMKRHMLQQHGSEFLLSENM